MTEPRRLHQQYVESVKGVNTLYDDTKGIEKEMGGNPYLGSIATSTIRLIKERNTPMSEKTDKKNKFNKSKATKVLALVCAGIIFVQIIAGTSFWLGTVYSNEQTNYEQSIKAEAVEAYKTSLKN